MKGLTVQGSNTEERQTDQMARYFPTVFLVRNLSLFEQGTISTIAGFHCHAIKIKIENH